jgi:ABC-2 type transport system permease protein
MTSAGLVWHQTRLEQRSFWRNPQSAFFTFALPVGLLVIFGAIAGNHAIPRLHGVRAPVLLVPGFLAFGIMVAVYQNLAATITLLRSEGVLKRIRSTPLQPSAYVAAHLGSGVITCASLAAVIVTLGSAVFGVTPLGTRSLLFVAVLVVGVTCFASLGLAITAAIPTADASGPVTNATYLPLAIVSGTFSYDLIVPAWLSRITALFPVKAFTDALRICYNPVARSTPTSQILVLVAWTLAGVVLTMRYFRWEP